MTARLPGYALAAAVAFAIAAGVALPAVFAAPAAKGPVRSVAIVAPAWLYSDGDLGLGVRVTTRKSTGPVRTEIDLLDAAGASVWHDLQSRTNLGSVTYEYSFSKTIGDLGVAPGIFTLRARVTSGGSAVAERSVQLIIVDRSMHAVPVSVIVRVAGTPSPDAEAEELTAADAADLGRLAELRPDLHLTVAVPPFLLARWSAADGSVEQSSAPAAGSEALASLRRALAVGTPFLRGMYADPDLAGIATATAELELQAVRGDAATAAFAGEPPVASAIATGFAALSGPLPVRAAQVMAARGVLYTVTDTASVVPASGRATPGAYRVTLPGGRSLGAKLTVLAADRAASALLASSVSASALAADLFSRATSGQRSRAVVLIYAVGADGSRTAQLAAALEALAGLPWVRLVNAPAAAAATDLPAATLREVPADPTPAPSGYWDSVGSARERVTGLVAAAGANDPDAKRALDALLLAESRAWAGPDGSWPEAARGLALARSAAKTADAVLTKVTLDAPSVTLPGSDGKAPVSIMNASGRSLVVELVASSSGLRVIDPRTIVHLRPGENVLSVPVSLGTAASGHVRFSVVAGGYRIASTTATVAASYQDRIVLLATALLILAGLLFYIRRRVVNDPGARPDRAGIGDDSETL